MSRSDCQRCVWLFDRESLGQPLDADELRFFSHHTRVCAACDREAVAFDTLRSVLSDLSTRSPSLRASPHRSSQAGRDDIEAILRASAVGPVGRALYGLRRNPATAIGLGGAFAAAAALALWVSLRPPAPFPEPHARVEVITPSAGGVQTTQLVIGETVHITAPGTCISIEPGVSACLQPGSTVRLVDNTLAHRELELVEGFVVASLEPQPPNSSFSVSHRGDSVRAVGTIFSVDSTVSTGTEVHVQHGVVAVRSVNGEPRMLRAHHGMKIHGGGERDLTMAEERADLSLLPRSAEAEKLAGFPLNLLPPPSVEPSFPADPLLARSRGPLFAGGASDTRKGRGVTLPIPAAAVSESTELSAEDSLRQARQLRAKGKIAEAAKVYGRLSRMIEAGGVADARIVKQARFGRIEALRALGQPAEEKGAIEALLREYPFGAHSEPMRARLRALNGEASP